ncbi:MAG TPA: hypothetical protein VK590_13060 [Saprospiraceae bacterium]|nr:hypothetical protein [Saprospiraceae bacterium]
MEICGKMESILDLSHENESIKIETLYASLKMMKIQEILKND